MTAGLFITGSDTDVGKTYVTALIAKTLRSQRRRVGVYKPVASGCTDLHHSDAGQLWEAAGRPLTLEEVCPQWFGQPLAPHLAAAAEGQRVNPKLLRSGLDVWKYASDFVLVEGAGGLMSPIDDDELVAQLAADIAYPLIVVVPNRVGVINQTLQTLITAVTFCEGLDVAGVILNDTCDDAVADDPSRTSNLEELKKWCVAPVIAHVHYGDKQFTTDIDWLALANCG